MTCNPNNPEMFQLIEDVGFVIDGRIPYWGIAMDKDMISPLGKTIEILDDELPEEK